MQTPTRTKDRAGARWMLRAAASSVAASPLTATPTHVRPTLLLFFSLLLVRFFFLSSSCFLSRSLDFRFSFPFLPPYSPFLDLSSSHFLLISFSLCLLFPSLLSRCQNCNSHAERAHRMGPSLRTGMLAESCLLLKGMRYKRAVFWIEDRHTHMQCTHAHTTRRCRGLPRVGL